MFQWIPVGPMAKIIIPVVFIGTVADIGTMPRKPEQCTLVSSSAKVVQYSCLGGSSNLRLNSTVHSPATLVTSKPVSVSGYPSRSLWYPADKTHQVFVIYDATDLTLRISSKVPFQETITFSRIR